MTNTFILLIVLMFLLLLVSFFAQAIRNGSEGSKIGMLKEYFKKHSYEDIAAHIAIASFLLLALLVIISKDFSYKPGSVFAFFIFSFFVVLAAFILLRNKKLISFVKSHKSAFGFGVASLVLFISPVSSAITDAVISETVGVEAANFPVAQKMLSIGVTFIVWLWVLALLSSFAYFLVGGYVAFGALWEAQNKSAKFYGPALKKIEDRKAALRYIRFAAASIGLLFFASLVPMWTLKAVDDPWVSKKIAQIIVFSSYHLSPAVCGISSPKDALVSQLRYKWASVAVPDEKKGYVFELRECPLKLVK